MEWKHITSEQDLIDLINDSHHYPQLIFKHSTTCSISSMVYNRLKKMQTEKIQNLYYLDLLQFRQISNLIAEKFNIQHQSPQILLIQNGSCVFSETHHAVFADEIIQNIK